MDVAHQVGGGHVVGEWKIRAVGLTPSKSSFDCGHPSGSPRAVVLPPQGVNVVTSGKEMSEEYHLVRTRRRAVDSARKTPEER